MVLQYERIEANVKEVDPSEETMDPISKLFHWISEFLNPKKKGYSIEDQYLYYRTQTILSRSVLRSLEDLNKEYTSLLFGASSVETIQRVYEIFLEGSLGKMEDAMKKMSKEAKVLSEKFARRAVLETESHLLEELFHRSMMTPKVYLSLKETIERESNMIAR